MALYVNGVLTPPVDAASLDGVTANLGTPGAPQDGYAVTYEVNTNELVLTAAGGGAPAGTGIVEAMGGAFRDPVRSASDVRTALGLGTIATMAAPWTASVAPVETRTTDATVTTIATISTTTDKGFTLQLLISATKSDRSAIVSWLYLVTVTNAAGVVTVRDSLALGPTDPASTIVAAVTPVAFDVSGTSVRVRGTGVVATAVDWNVSVIAMIGGA